jgi:hypothetical protein
VRAAWREAGREGEPELRALQYYALGPDAESGRANLLDYYGSDLTGMIWPSVPLDADGLRQVARRFEEIGATEVLFVPTVASLQQLELLAQAVL